MELHRGERRQRQKRRGLAGAGLAGLAVVAASCGTVNALAHPGTTSARPAAREAASRPAPAMRSLLVGKSLQGRPITAFERPAAATSGRVTKLMVVGVIHGDERSGLEVVQNLRTMPLPPNIDLVVIPELNPDGVAARTHKNADRVDLNRNFGTSDYAAAGSQKQASGVHNSGPHADSEPEVVAFERFAELEKPDVTAFYHQPLDTVDCNEAASPELARICNGYAQRVTAGGTALETSYNPRPGAATQWLIQKGLGVSFVVEFANYSGPAPGNGMAPPALARLHAEALLGSVEAAEA